MELGKAGMLDGEHRAEVSAALVARLADYDVTVASPAAAALEFAGDPSAAPALFNYLASYDPPDARAFGAVVRHGGRKGLDFALARIKSGSWSAKYFALRALRYAPEPSPGAKDEAAGELLEAWRDPESPHQDVAARSLRALGERAVPFLARIVRSGEPGARRRAAALLGEIGEEIGSVPASRALVAAIEAGDAALAFVADQALGRISGREPSLGLRSSPEERRKASAGR